MDADGGAAKYSTNKGGAKYGTGYCDAQCPHDVKWINGLATSKDWEPIPSDANSGKGYYGNCCAELVLLLLLALLIMLLLSRCLLAGAASGSPDKAL